MKLEALLNNEFNFYFPNLRYIIVFYLQLILLHNHYNMTIAKAFVGHNIRAARGNEFPYVVAFAEFIEQAPPESRVWCSGSFITSNHVLTAEHCIDVIVYEVAVVLIAESHLLNNCKYYTLCWWISYNQWAAVEGIQLRYARNDISIVKTVYSVSSQVTPATMLVDNENTRLYGKKVNLVGWGDNSNHSTPTALQTVQVTVLTKSECDSIVTRLHGSTIRLHSRFLCTKAVPYVHLGDGDSGGPVIYEGNILAINTGICPTNGGVFHEDQINTHIDVYYYRDFIAALMSI